MEQEVCDPEKRVKIVEIGRADRLSRTNKHAVTGAVKPLRKGGCARRVGATELR